ncbi:MAG: phosphotransferase family protein [Spirochaetaceae bacterium]|nr:phosphotransferase family protein [Myxococcales bacterium]MCB9724296.1 phosphotransferase family protein [Spirochaetaceae bacterium]HPG25004.1 phosphotransferase family protein [Myxococcota bacterium]
MSDAASLERLAARLAPLFEAGARVSIRGVASVGAQRRTLFVDVRNAEVATRAVVQIMGDVLAATDVECEAALLRKAGAEGVPVPAVLAVDASLRAIASEHVEGESIPRRILRLVDATPELGERLTRDCGEALAAIHRIGVAALPELPDLADPGRYVDELERLLDSLSTPHPVFRLGVGWLRRHAPSPPERATLVHGDFRLGNLLVDEGGLRAVLDWELAHLGDPMEDLAWLCLRTWRFGRDDRSVGGFGSLDRLRDAYVEAGGVFRTEAFAWWTVARTVWWGLGLARQVQAVLDGQADSIVLAASGRRVVELEYDLLEAIRPGD